MKAIKRGRRRFQFVANFAFLSTSITNCNFMYRKQKCMWAYFNGFAEISAWNAKTFPRKEARSASGFAPKHSKNDESEIKFAYFLSMKWRNSSIVNGTGCVRLLSLHTRRLQSSGCFNDIFSFFFCTIFFLFEVLHSQAIFTFKWFHYQDEDTRKKRKRKKQR